MDYKKLADMLFPNAESAEEILAKYPPRSLPKGAEVTRFAPSPTGMMHMGGFFQVLIGKTLARNTSGVFYLRNEDTDKKREVPGAAQAIFDLLCDFGQKPDEYQKYGQAPVGNYGPYIQSQRTNIYHAFAKKLVAEGKAFPCFCRKSQGIEAIEKERQERYSHSSSNAYFDPCRDLTLEEIEQKLKKHEKFAIRLKTQHTGEGKCEFIDLVKGKVFLPENARDVVLIKRDGLPPYAFAHAVDDTLMGTTIVTRGSEWYTATPEHIEIFNALGFAPKKYFHTPLIWKIDEKTGKKRKISKRKDPEFFMEYFLQQGYPVMAVVEYLMNIINSGFEPWRAKNPDTAVTEFKFAVNDITTVSPLYDQAKLNDTAKNVVARMSGAQLYENWLEWSRNYNTPLYEKLKLNRDYCIKICSIGREQPRPRKDIYCYSKIEQEFDYMFDCPKKRELDKADKKIYKEFISAYAQDFTLPASKEEWFAGVKDLAQKLGYCIDNKEYKANPTLYKGNTAKACELLRIAITGRKDSPDLYEIMTVLGQERVSQRLAQALENKKDSKK